MRRDMYIYMCPVFIVGSSIEEWFTRGSINIEPSDISTYILSIVWLQVVDIPVN